ncbi:hypothetical protein PPERSA_04186 [Pseudocohnilembus persalinus]|uniref:Uncharacterized protein n=1 Tax=Pseudocohnilembus persalinus TaxID=266149 RepID=A0A0V0QMZ8_PSEPJ|nr:hypothetical protein PPERSA_04186 [Pseudocohnilembus persalinus]|eukprot:KRX03634.1 hypothetical protein PPERSA_04186 [Pseudocohnilembus persalinus]
MGENQIYDIDQKYIESLKCDKHPQMSIQFISLENGNNDKILCKKCVQEQQKLQHQIQNLPEFLQNLFKVVYPQNYINDQKVDLNSKDKNFSGQKMNNQQIKSGIAPENLQEISTVDKSFNGNYFLQKQMQIKKGIISIKANYENQLNDLIQNYADNIQEMFTNSMDHLYEMISEVYEKQQKYLSEQDNQNAQLQKQIVALNFLYDFQQGQKLNSKNNGQKLNQKKGFDFNQKIQLLQNGSYELDEIELSFQNILNYINHFFGNYMEQLQQSVIKNSKEFEENLQAIKERFGESYQNNFQAQKIDYSRELKQLFPNLDINNFIDQKSSNFKTVSNNLEQCEAQNNLYNFDDEQQEKISKHLLTQSYYPKIIAPKQPFKKQSMLYKKFNDSQHSQCQNQTCTQFNQEINEQKKQIQNGHKSSFQLQQDMDFLKLSPRNYQPNKSLNSQQQIKSFFKINTIFKDPAGENILPSNQNKEIDEQLIEKQAKLNKAHQKKHQSQSLTQKSLQSVKDKISLNFLEDSQNLYYNNYNINQIQYSNGKSNNPELSKFIQQQQSDFPKNQLNDINEKISIASSIENGSVSHSNRLGTPKGPSFIQKIFGNSGNNDLLMSSPNLLQKTQNNQNLTENSMLNSAGHKSSLNGSLSYQNLKQIPKTINLRQFGSDTKLKGFLENVIKQKKMENIQQKYQSGKNQQQYYSYGANLTGSEPRKIDFQDN